MDKQDTLSEQAILVIGTSAMVLMAFAIIFFIYLYQRKLLNRNLENQKIQDLLQQQEVQTAYALLEGQDKERKRIASELHDNLGSILVTLNMYADALQTKTKLEEIKDISSRISNVSRTANEEVRKISHSLDSGLLKHFGLEAAISQLMEAVEMSKRIKIELDFHLENHIANELGLQIYRIIQELVNNTLKHANCSKIHLELNQIDNGWSIIYHDNGKGFNLMEVKRGMGLSNIERRTDKLGGELKIESSERRGSTFILDVPSLG